MPIPLDDAFPAAYARTDRFRRGAPRSFTVTDEHVTFLRSAGPTDGRLSLWRLHIDSGREECLVDSALLVRNDSALPDAERARRERMRESGAGITAYSQSASGHRIAFAAGGSLWLWDATGLRDAAVSGAVVDPRLDASGDLISCIIDGAVCVVNFVDAQVTLRVAREGRTVGLADFAAAEELNRFSGQWWSPTGDALLLEVVDESAVPLWTIADPTHPDRAPRTHRYPHAGATNARCSLLFVDLASGREREVTWNDFEYLVSVRWTSDGPPLVTLATRDQTTFATFTVDGDGLLHVAHEDRGEPWLEVVTGVPAWLPDGRLVHTIDDASCDTRRVAVAGVPITPAAFHVASVLHVGAEGIVVAGTTDARVTTALHIAPDGSQNALSSGFTHCQFTGNGSTHVRVTVNGETTERVVDVLRGSEVVGHIACLSERPAMPTPGFTTLGTRALNAVVLWPERPVEGRLPVILSPYGGPHHVEVIAAAATFADDQWLANQGFCVVIADGRGTPGRGLEWEFAVRDSFATVTLEDQIAALEAVLALYPDRLDRQRVGIRGWSYGGYLSALAMLARPDVFHAAVAGAPVTEWTLYDTAYTERYLGDPRERPDVYRANSLLPLAGNLRGELLIVHGLADDNVVSAHSLQLSAALLAEGRRHAFLPLAGVSHMTPQEVVAENLLRLQADFFRQALR